MNKVKKIVGLCAGRHEITGVDEYIYQEISDPTDVKAIQAVADKWVYENRKATEMVVYVTGLTVAFAAVVHACQWHEISLVAMHFDRETGEYFPQDVLGYYNKE